MYKIKLKSNLKAAGVPLKTFEQIVLGKKSGEYVVPMASKHLNIDASKTSNKGKNKH